MKKRIFGLLMVLVLLMTILALPAMADRPEDKPDKCTTIQDGILLDSNGNVISVGYDQWGYNYQAHIFNGFYGNYSRPDVLVTEGTLLIMKWSDTWLSNKDCNEDGKLDRGYSCDPVNADSSACVGAWVTNHQSGSYVGEDGKTYKWNYFVKIVCVPEDAYKVDGIWYTADGTEIGSVIWTAYARVLQVYNDQGTGEHGVEYLSPAGPGLGKW